MFHILESLGRGQGIRKVVQAWAQTDHCSMVLHTVQEAAISASHLLNANIVAQSFDKNKTLHAHISKLFHPALHFSSFSIPMKKPWREGIKGLSVCRVL